jgi:hypothetical protein
MMELAAICEAITKNISYFMIYDDYDRAIVYVLMCQKN